MGPVIGDVVYALLEARCLPSVFLPQSATVLRRDLVSILTVPLLLQSHNVIFFIRNSVVSAKLPYAPWHSIGNIAGTPGI